MKLKDFACCDDPTVKVEAVAVHDMPTVAMPAVSANEQRYAQLYLLLRELGASEELAQSILKLVRFEVEA